MDRAVSTIPSMEPSFSQPIRDNVLESISQIDGQIVIKIAGDDLVEAEKNRGRRSSAKSARYKGVTAPRSTASATFRTC